MSNKLGSILLDNSLIDDDSLQLALNYHKETGYPLGECLLHLNLVSEEIKTFGLVKQIDNRNERKKKWSNFSELMMLFKYMLQRKKILVIIVLLCVLAALFSVPILMPLLFGFVIDYVIVIGNKSLLLTIILIGTSGVILSAILEVLMHISINMFVANIGRRIQVDFFSHLNSLAYPFYQRFKKGDIINRITDNLEGLTEIIKDFFSQFIQGILIFIIMSIILIQFNLWLALATFFILLLCIIIPAQIGAKANPFLKEVPIIRGNFSSMVQEALSSFFFIKAGNRQEVFRSRVHKNLYSMYIKFFNALILWNLSFNLRRTLTNLVSVLIVYVGGHLVITGHFSIGMLTTFYFLVIQFIPRLDIFYNLFVYSQYSKTLWVRLEEIMNLPVNDFNESINVRDPFLNEMVISLKRVSFRYSLKNESTLSGLNVTLKKGRKYALIGESGSGKSTFLKLLMGLYIPNEGSIQYGTNTLDRMNLFDLWSRIGYLGQEPIVFKNMTIEDNIKFGVTGIGIVVDRQAVVVAAHNACIHDHIMTLPEGYDTMIGEDMAGLSGGEKQRLVMARIFIRDPLIYILDEPTSALDAENSDLVFKLVNSLDDKIVLVSTHKLDYLKGYSNLLYFNSGKLEVVEDNCMKVEQYLTNFNGMVQ